MTTPNQKDLMYAILSMDSYNRGYNAGISNLGGEGALLGAIEVSKNAEQLLDAGAAQSAGFYAVAYQWNGETIISYRGTSAESVLEFLKDANSGWATCAGGYLNEQAKLAAEFYQAVTGTQTTDPGVISEGGNASPVTLVGHSLGGGLPGLAAKDNHPLPRALTTPPRIPLVA
jgi:hypothetical protein